MIENKNYLMAIYQLIRTGHWITDQVGLELKEYAISEPQYNVLRVLKARKGRPITVIEIQERMVQRSSNVTRIIDKLIERGLVLRQECQANRRKMDITITDKGALLLEKLDEKVNAFHQPLSHKISQEEARELTKLIIKLKGE